MRSNGKGEPHVNTGGGVVVVHSEDRRVLVYGPLAMDLIARSVKLGDTELTLTAKEFDLLAFLAARPGQALSRDELLR
jgi:DNA-binding response OmpR family regulator